MHRTHKLHRSLGSTTIYVTHDQVEAMTMADHIVIMKDGVVQQVGKPMNFTGIRKTNLLQALKII